MIYCYETDDGVIHEITMSNQERESRQRGEVIVLDDGREARRNYEAERGSARSGSHGWPMTVEFDAPVGDKKAFNAMLASKGVSQVDFNKRGYRVTSPSHYRAVLAARGRFNKDDVRSPRNV